MNSIHLGIILGVVLGFIDVAMTIRHPGVSTETLLGAFSSRFAVGLLAANVNLRMNPIVTGALVGLLISLPDAFAMKSYPGILGSGLVFGAFAGWAASKWGS
jgi:hypothetical protein